MSHQPPMASPPLLEFEELLEPVSENNPAGEAEVPFKDRERLLNGRQPQGADGKCDWPVVIRTAKDVLRRTSKSLEVATRLTEALAMQHGFAGLQAGLYLLRRLVDERWDALNPPLQEEGAVAARAGCIKWLGDPDRGAQFPFNLKSLPLVAANGVQLSYHDWEQPELREEWQKTVQDASAERCLAVKADLEQCLNEVDLLQQGLEARMGEETAPSLVKLRDAIQECHDLMEKGVLPRKKRPEAEQKTNDKEEGPKPPDPAEGSRALSRFEGTSRDEIYAQLGRLADELCRLEKHSPVSCLIRYAVRLGRMPFEDLYKEYSSQDLWQLLNRLTQAQPEQGSRNE